ncbi:MAG: hypothetical protein ACOC7L_04150 [Acidobacteriota bacterium]
MSRRRVNPAGEASAGAPGEAPVLRDEHTEGTLTRLIEQQTAKIPSSAFLVAGLGALTASLVFELTGRQRWSRFVGMWAPTLLIVGVYNKLVKTFGPR